MIYLEFTGDWRRFRASLDDFGRRALPAATARALNGTAFIARSIIQREMQTSFDRPNRWTLGGVLVERASPQNLEAAVGLKDRVDIRKSRGLPLSAYLRTQIDGGERGQKSHEKALASAGILTADQVLVPTKYADLDAHGNMSVGQINKILSSLNAFGEQGYSANAWGRKGRGARKGETYFAIRPGQPQGRNGGGALPPGIYKATESGLGRIVVPVAVITRRGAHYTSRFDFEGIVDRIHATYFPKLLGEEVEKAMREAKP